MLWPGLSPTACEPGLAFGAVHHYLIMHASQEVGTGIQEVWEEHLWVTPESWAE